jgi:hypothetical protein
MITFHAACHACFVCMQAYSTRLPQLLPLLPLRGVTEQYLHSWIVILCRTRQGNAAYFVQLLLDFLE